MYVSTYPDGILHMMAMTLFEENNDNTRGNIIDALTRAPSFFETPGFLTKLIDVAFQQDVSSSAVQHTSPSVQRQEGRNNDVLPDVTGPVEDVLNRNNHAHREKTRQKSGSESAKKGGRPLDNVRGRPPLQNSSSRHLSPSRPRPPSVSNSGQEFPPRKVRGHAPSQNPSEPSHSGPSYSGPSYSGPSSTGSSSSGSSSSGSSSSGSSSSGSSSSGSSSSGSSSSGSYVCNEDAPCNLDASGILDVITLTRPSQIDVALSVFRRRLCGLYEIRRANNDTYFVKDVVYVKNAVEVINDNGETEIEISVYSTMVRNDRVVRIKEDRSTVLLRHAEDDINPPGRVITTACFERDDARFPLPFNAIPLGMTARFEDRYQIVFDTRAALTFCDPYFDVIDVSLTDAMRLTTWFIKKAYPSFKVAMGRGQRDVAFDEVRQKFIDRNINVEDMSASLLTRALSTDSFEIGTGEEEHSNVRLCDSTMRWIAFHDSIDEPGRVDVLTAVFKVRWGNGYVLCMSSLDKFRARTPDDSTTNVLSPAAKKALLHFVRSPLNTTHPPPPPPPPRPHGGNVIFTKTFEIKPFLTSYIAPPSSVDIEALRVRILIMMTLTHPDTVRGVDIRLIELTAKWSQAPLWNLRIDVSMSVDLEDAQCYRIRQMIYRCMRLSSGRNFSIDLNRRNQ